METLRPEDWFVRGHEAFGGTYDDRGFRRKKGESRSLLVPPPPPPAAADVALEEMRKAWIKRQLSTHIFVCPRLLTTEWLKQCHKAADCLFELPVGFSVWPDTMYEPLKIAICFPFLSRPPWRVQNTPKMLEVGRQMRKVFHEGGLDAGNILRQLLLEHKRFHSMPQDVVWSLLYFKRGHRFPCGQIRRGERDK